MQTSYVARHTSAVGRERISPCEFPHAPARSRVPERAAFRMDGFVLPCCSAYLVQECCQLAKTRVGVGLLEHARQLSVKPSRNLADLSG